LEDGVVSLPWVSTSLDCSTKKPLYNRPGIY
jgi:hypothetical protein